MDEKTDDASQIVDAALAPDEGTSAGTDSDANLLSTVSTDTDSFISSETSVTNATTTESTETDVTATIALPADLNNSLEDALPSENVSTEVSAAETSTVTNVSATLDTTLDEGPPAVDAITVEPPAEETKAMEEESCVDEVKASAEPMEIDKDEEEEEEEAEEEEKLVEKSTPEHVDTSVAVCQLEEELKRLHEGDPSEDEAKNDNSLNGDLLVKSMLEEKDSVVHKASKVNGKSKMKEVGSTLQVKKLEEKPIMKDSDLEEMLSADDVAKDPILIKEAQDDLKITDVLVCGKCHEVFHFLEEFQSHKSVNCIAKSAIVPICEGETKPQVWGFTLWKNKQHRYLKPSEPVPSSWATYQKWCKLPPIDKNAWISAGQTLQFCYKVGAAKVIEAKTKPPPKVERDPLALDGFESNKENSNIDNSFVRVTRSVKPVKVNKEPPVVTPPVPKASEANSNKAFRTVKSTETKEYAVERIVAKRFNPKKKCWEYQIKWEHFPSDDNTWEPVSNLTHCKRMVDEFEEALRKLKAEKAKQQQQLQQQQQQAAQVSMVKNRKVAKESPSVSTPSAATSKYSLSTSRPQRTSKQKALNQVKAWCGNISDEDTPTGGVKRKLDSDDSDDSFEKKMKYEEYSDDSDLDIKPTLPPTPKLTPFRKIAPKPSPQQPQQSIQIIKNGMDKMNPLPHNVLIPDANGVVRINQKQLPSLSTGVYIMSKTAGIIKLDSTTSKVATSGGQTIVKVAPKIGQTQIKIVKKDGTTTTTKQIVQTVPNKSPATTKMYKPIITKVKKPSEVVKKSPDVTKKTPEVVKRITEIVRKNTEIVKTPHQIKKPEIIVKHAAPKPPTPTKITRIKEEVKEIPPPEEDSDDDGLEELPFPDEITIPEPPSPPGEFTLDPITGKIAGVEYPELPEPEPEELEPVEEAKSDTSLDNIVKLAAADITEEDLKNEPVDVPMNLNPLSDHHEEEDEDEEEEEEEMIRKVPERRLISAPSHVQPKPIIKVGMVTGMAKPKPASSILNKVLTGTPIIRRTPASPGSGSRVQQRILNQSVARSPLSSVVRVGNTTYVRKPATPRPKYVSSSSKIIKAQHEASAAKNVYTYSRPVVQGMTRKIGNTTIRSANMGMNSGMVQQKAAVTGSLIAQRPMGAIVTTPRPQARIVQTSPNVQKIVSPKKESLIRHHPDKKMVVTSKIVSTRQATLPPPQPMQTIAKPKTVISMPSLLGDDEPESSLSPPELRKTPSPPPPITPTLIAATTSTPPTPIIEHTPTSVASSESSVDSVENSAATTDSAAAAAVTAGDSMTTDLSSFTLADNENPIFITGDDGTVYQVAGQNEQGQTILLTQGSDGQQQCLLVTSEVAEAMEAATEEPPGDVPMPDISENVTEPLSIKTDAESNDQVVAQVVRAEPPSPGGTHKVVVMLPDGNLMVTQVSPEEYASLELE